MIDFFYRFAILIKVRQIGVAKMLNNDLFENTAITVDDIWGSAVYAYRKNKNNYFSRSSFSRSYNKDATPNVEIGKEALRNTSLLTSNDVSKGKAIREYFQGLIFKQLASTINDFERGMLKIAEKSTLDEWKETKYSYGMLCSMIKTYERNVSQELVSENSTHFGSVGDRLTLKIKINSSVYSANWGTFYITALTSDNNLVLFPFKEELADGTGCTVKGTVKSHRDNNITQLNRVVLQKH